MRRLMTSVLLALTLMGCAGSPLYRIAVVNDVRAEGLLRVARLERQWFEAGAITGADHAEWTRQLTLAAESGKRLTQAIRLADEGRAYDAIAEILTIAKLLVADQGMVAKLPPELQTAAFAILDGVILALATMQMTLEASHDPSALDPRDLRLVYLPDPGGDFPGGVDLPHAQALVQ